MVKFGKQKWDKGFLSAESLKQTYTNSKKSKINVTWRNKVKSIAIENIIIVASKEKTFSAD